MLLRITGPEEFRLTAHSDLRGSDRPAAWTTATREAHRVLGLIQVEGSTSGVTFAVEGQPDAAANHYCRGGSCFDVGVEVHREGGLLYPRLQDYGGRVDTVGGKTRVDDFVAQRIEVSAEDDSSGRKVYRELLVAAPARSPFCDDFQAKDASRFECVFNRQRLPTASWSTPEEATLVQSLPDKLVYAKEDYSLVFAEDFDGESEQPDSCWNGMDTLDTGVWNYRGGNSCERVDSSGVPCESIDEGHLRLGKSYGSCQTPGINTHGKFEYRYGYLEAKYIFRVHPRLFYYNHSFVIGNIDGARRELWGRYNVVVDSYEGIARHHDVEIDVFEETPSHKIGISHEYINASSKVYAAAAAPRSSRRETTYCNHRNSALNFRPRGCVGTYDVVVTRGIEWTPRGYRTLLKVEGVHDDFIVYPERLILLSEDEVSVSSSGKVTFPKAKVLTGDARSRFFERLDAADPDSRLVQLAIAHKPQSISIGTWGYPQSNHRTIPSLLRVDYVRVFQPANGYSDMEPLYQ